eukprot:g18433.t1
MSNFGPHGAIVELAEWALPKPWFQRNAPFQNGGFNGGYIILSSLMISSYHGARRRLIFLTVVDASSLKFNSDQVIL